MRVTVVIDYTGFGFLVDLKRNKSVSRDERRVSEILSVNGRREYFHETS